MNNKFKQIRQVLPTIIFLCLTASGFSQKTSIDQRRLNRDLRIMEGILDKLFKGRASSHYFNGRTKAVYLPGFGVVFHTSQKAPVHRDFNIALRYQFEAVQEMADKVRDEHEEVRREVEETREKIEEAAEAATEAQRLARSKSDIDVAEEILLDSDKIIEDEKKTIDNYKKNILVFFRNYTSAIGQLRPHDRIAVLINLRGWESLDTESPFLTGWISKQDIDRYRQNQMNESEFKKNIHFQLADVESDIDMDISILSEILDRAMDSSSFWRESSNSGLYIGGLGALLFMELPSMYLTIPGADNLISVIEGQVNENVVAIAPYSRKEGEKEKEKKKTEDEVIQEVQDELFELIASYGHTLRLKPQESIVVNVNLGTRLISYARAKKSPSRLILQLKKKDLDDYNRGIITLANLRNKLIRQTY